MSEGPAGSGVCGAIRRWSSPREVHFPPIPPALSASGQSDLDLEPARVQVCDTSPGPQGPRGYSRLCFLPFKKKLHYYFMFKYSLFTLLFFFAVPANVIYF